MSFRLNPTRSVFETLYPSLSERVRLWHSRLTLTLPLLARYSKKPESGSDPSENGGVNTGSVVHMACWATSVMAQSKTSIPTETPTSKRVHKTRCSTISVAGECECCSTLHESWDWLAAGSSEYLTSCICRTLLPPPTLPMPWQQTQTPELPEH